MTARRARFAPSPWLAAAWIAAIVACSGCGDRLELIPVHGRVTFRGEPLAFGSVMFQPEGAGPLARGTIQEDGSFVMGTLTEDDGVRPGACRVRITAYKAQQSEVVVTGQTELALGPSFIPEKYNGFGSSGLEFEIGPETELPLVIELE